MTLPRIAFAFASVLLLAACDNSPKPPATPAPAAESPAVVAPTPAAPAMAASAEAMDPMIGTWSVDLAACGSAGATIKVAEARFESADRKCDITALGDNGDGSFAANLSCDGKAETVKMVPVFAPTGEGINLTYPDGSEVTVLRCKAPATAAQ